MHKQMNHFELDSESGKVAQSLKKMCVDGGTDAHHQSGLVAEQKMQKEARTGSNRTRAISTVETSPGKVTPPLRIGGAKSGIFDQMHFHCWSIVKVVHREKQTKWIVWDDEIIQSQRGGEVEELWIQICRL